MSNNVVLGIALNHGRSYITPEDIGVAFRTHDVDKVRLDVLEMLGQSNGEDKSLCAFVAFQGEASSVDDDEE